jgi:hypothetical protein
MISKQFENPPDIYSEEDEDSNKMQEAREEEGILMLPEEAFAKFRNRLDAALVE